MHRREFLKYGAGVVAAIAAGGAGAVFSRSPRTAAAAPSLDSGAVLDQFSYRGRLVQIVQHEDHVMMVLDGRALPHYAFMQLSPNRYSSHLLGFEDEPTARILAQKLIDNDGRLFIL